MAAYSSEEPGHARVMRRSSPLRRHSDERFEIFTVAASAHGFEIAAHVGAQSIIAKSKSLRGGGTGARRHLAAHDPVVRLVSGASDPAKVLTLALSY